MARFEFPQPMATSNPETRRPRRERFLNAIGLAILGVVVLVVGSITSTVVVFAIGFLVIILAACWFIGALVLPGRPQNHE